MLAEFRSEALDLQTHTIWLLQHVPSMIFVFCLGACVGSFLNVVVYRLPAGMSVITPPSRCPTCGARLRFFRENLPILGWFLVRGKCRYCAAPVSIQYMLIELLMAVTFLVLYAVLFLAGSHAPWWSEIGGAWWTFNTFFRVWPAYLVFAFMIAGLIAMTLIDARTFTIPIQIPTFVIGAAFLGYGVQALLPIRMPPAETWPIPGVNWPWALAAFGGIAGVLIGVALLKSRRLRYSFADYEEYLPPLPEDAPAAESDRVTVFELVYFLPTLLGLLGGALLGWRYGVGVGVVMVIIGVLVLVRRHRARGAASLHGPSGEEVLAEYPHARREMLIEVLFLLPCLLLGAGGFLLGGMMADEAPPLFIQAIGASMLGYLVGGGLIWGIRILGTLAFGREAMGLGDVHLLGAVGAALGWFDPILIFFIAPFSGLLWVLLSIILASVLRNPRREIPYGPHLAVAVLVVVFARPALQQGWEVLLPGVPWPSPGLVMQDAS